MYRISRVSTSSWGSGHLSPKNRPTFVFDDKVAECLGDEASTPRCQYSWYPNHIRSSHQSSTAFGSLWCFTRHRHDSSETVFATGWLIFCTNDVVKVKSKFFIERRHCSLCGYESDGGRPQRACWRTCQRKCSWRGCRLRRRHGRLEELAATSSRRGSK